MAKTKSSFLVFFTLTGTSLLVLNCAPEKKAAELDRPNSPDIQIQSASLEESKKIILQSDVILKNQDQKNYHPSVAFMASALEEGVSTCTASLISDNRVLTNSHCVPNDLKAPGSNCSGRILFTFPDGTDVKGATYSKEIMGCERVITASRVIRGGTVETTDYAILQIERSHRPALMVDLSGIEDEETLTVFKMNPISKTRPLAAFDQSTCVAKQRTSYFLDYFEKNSPVVTFSDCELVHGNSGAALLSREGKIKGVAQAGLNTGRVGSLFRQYYPKVSFGFFKQVNLGTQAKCFADSSLAHPTNDCEKEFNFFDQNSSWVKKVHHPAWMKQDENFVNSLVAKYFQRNVSDFEFASVTLNTENRMKLGLSLSSSIEYTVVVPKCIKASSQILSKKHFTLQNEFNLNELTMVADEYGRLNLMSRDLNAGEFEIKITELKNLPASPARLTYSFELKGNSKAIRFPEVDLPLCKQQ